MNYNLFLGDIRIPVDVLLYINNTIYGTIRWEVVRNYSEFVSIIEEKGLPSKISFDHDLADEHYAPREFWDEKYNDWVKNQNFLEKTGHDCAKWLTEYCVNNNLELPAYLVHSMNPVGAKNITDHLENYLKK